MKAMTRRNFRPVVLLVLLALLALVTYLAFRRNVYTVEEAEDEAAREVAKAEDVVVHNPQAGVAILVLVALFTFVMWTALRANTGEDKATPPARESSASDDTARR